MFILILTIIVSIIVWYGVGLYLHKKPSKIDRYINTYKPDPQLTKKRKNLIKKALLNPVKVFQIGFRNCGATMLFEFFNRNGIAAIHTDNGNFPPGIYKKYWVFSALEDKTLFRELDKQYPGSKFILNTGDKQIWLKNRSQQFITDTDGGITTILDLSKKTLNKSEKEVLKQWSEEWDELHQTVTAYFKDRPSDLLVFNIDEDLPEKLTTFFKPNFVMDPELYDPLNPLPLNHNKKQKRMNLVNKALIKPVKVFQIGFSKCGTSTLANLFHSSGVDSVHHDHGNLALSMYNNFSAGKPLISSKYKDIWFFTDMERMYGDPPLNIGMLLFKELDKQYPGSKFILNIRDKQAWLKSRSKHTFMPNISMTLLEINQKTLKLSKEQVLAKWAKEWDQHHKAVKEYFKDRPNDLLVFNIDTDSPEKLVNFFKENFHLDPTLYGHLNKTSYAEKRELLPPLIWRTMG